MDTEKIIVLTEDMTVELGGNTSKVYEISKDFRTNDVRMGKKTYQIKSFEYGFETPIMYDDRVYCGFDVVGIDGVYEIELKTDLTGLDPTNRFCCFVDLGLFGTK